MRTDALNTQELNAKLREPEITVAKLKEYLRTWPDQPVDFSGISERALDGAELPLHVAIREGDPEIVGLLLRKKAEIQAVGVNGTTALHCAARATKNTAAIMHELFKEPGALTSVNAKDATGHTPLDIARANGNQAAVDKLIEASLHHAVMAGNVDMTSQLLGEAKNASLIDVLYRLLAPEYDGFGYAKKTVVNEQQLAACKSVAEEANKMGMLGQKAIVALAARWEHTNVVKLLLEAGAPVDMRDDGNNSYSHKTPLHIAIQNDNVNCVKLLLEYKADPKAMFKESSCIALVVERLVNYSSSFISNPEIEKENAQIEILGLLLKHGAEVSSNLFSVRSGGRTSIPSKYWDRVGVILEPYIPPELATELYQRKLWEILKQWNDKNIEKTKADELAQKATAILTARKEEFAGKWPDYKDSDNNTIMDVIIDADNADAFKLLVAMGAPITSEMECLMLCKAVAGGRAKTVELLVERGVSVDTETFHLAAKQGHANVVQYLIDRGVEVNSVDNMKRQALHIAKTPAVVDVLLAKGVDIDVLDQWSRTPLHWAIIHNNDSVALHLIGKEANIEARTKSRPPPAPRTGYDDMSVLGIAIEQERAEVIKVLFTKGVVLGEKEIQAARGKSRLINNLVQDYTRGIKPAINSTTAPTKLVSNAPSTFSSSSSSSTSSVSTTTMPQPGSIPPAHPLEADTGSTADLPDTTIHSTFASSSSTATSNSSTSASVEPSKVHELNAKLQEPEITAEKLEEYFADWPQPLHLSEIDLNGEEPPLHVAARTGNKEIVEVLLARGADVNVTNKLGMTPLHMAASPEVVDVLLYAGAGIEILDRKDRDGGTPLHRSIIAGHTAVALHCINKGAALHGEISLYDRPELQLPEALRHKGHQSPIGLAIFLGNIDVMKGLLAQGALLPDICSTDQINPAIAQYLQDHKAVRQQFFEACHSKTDSKAALNLMTNEAFNVHDRDGLGQTPLHWAAEAGRADVVEALLNKDADIGALDINGNSALHTAVTRNRPNVARLLLEQGAEYTKHNLGNHYAYSTEHHPQTQLKRYASYSNDESLHLTYHGKTPEALIPERPTSGEDPYAEMRQVFVEGTKDRLQRAVIAGNDKAVTRLIKLHSQETIRQVLSYLLQPGSGLMQGNHQNSGQYHALRALLANPLLVKPDTINQPIEGELPLAMALKAGYESAAIALIEAGSELRWQTTSEKSNKSVSLLEIARENNLYRAQTDIVLNGFTSYPPEVVDEERKAELNAQALEQVQQRRIVPGDNNIICFEIGRLLDEGADINHYTLSLDGQKSRAKGLLYYAIKAADFKTVRMLFARGARINILNDEGETLLSAQDLLDLVPVNNQRWVARQDPKKLKECVKIEEFIRRRVQLTEELNKLIKEYKNSGPGLAEYGEYDESIPLPLEQIRDLVAKGADPNGLGTNGKVPLHNIMRERVSEDKALELTKELLILGANIEQRDKDRRSPLSHAVFKGHRKTADYLIDKGANVAYQGKNSWTILCDAAFGGGSKYVRKGVSAGLDVNKPVGRPPLILAAIEAQDKVIGALLEAGADPNSKSKLNKSPLYYAGYNPIPDSTALDQLLAAGADVNVKCANGYTALHIAVASIHMRLETVQSILTKATVKADVNIPDDDGNTPLHLLAMNVQGYGKIQVFDLLKANGASLNALNKAGKTPLDLAIEYDTIAEHMRENGCKTSHPEAASARGGSSVSVNSSSSSSSTGTSSPSGYTLTHTGESSITSDVPTGDRVGVSVLPDSGSINSTLSPNPGSSSTGGEGGIPLPVAPIILRPEPALHVNQPPIVIAAPPQEHFPERDIAQQYDPEEAKSMAILALTLLAAVGGAVGHSTTTYYFGPALLQPLVEQGIISQTAMNWSKVGISGGVVLPVAIVALVLLWNQHSEPNQAAGAAAEGVETEQIKGLTGRQAGLINLAATPLFCATAMMVSMLVETGIQEAMWANAAGIVINIGVPALAAWVFSNLFMDGGDNAKPRISI